MESAPPKNQCENEQERKKRQYIMENFKQILRQKTLNNLLRHSASNGHIIDVKKWVKAGAEIDTTDNDDRITIIDGQDIENYESQDFLTQNIQVYTPLQAALSSSPQKRSHYDVVEFLLKKGANPNSQTPIPNPNPKQPQGDIVIFTPAFQAVLNNNIAVLKLLLAYGADINFKNYYEANIGLLIQAFSQKSYEMVEFLIKNGIDLKNCTDTSGKTALHHALENGFNLKIIKLLLDNGADLKATALNGKTPMHSAVEAENLKMVKFLFEQGLDINSSKKQELSYSIEDHSDRWILKMTPLQIAVYKKNYEIVEFLLENGADVNQRLESLEGFSSTALHFAIRNTNNNIAEILMKYNADVDALETDTSSKFSTTSITPLHLAANLGHHLIVRNLLKKGDKIFFIFSVNY